MDNFNLMIIKEFYSSKNTLKKIKAHKLGKVFSKHILIKNLCTEFIRKFYNLITQSTHNMDTNFEPKFYQRRYMSWDSALKKCSTSLVILLLFSCSVMSDSLQPHGLQHARAPCPSPTPGACSNSCMFIESVMSSNHLILCHPLLLLLSIFPSIRVFSSALALHIRWSKNWSFSSSISLSHEYSGLIPFRIAWFDLLAVQGTFKFESISVSVLSLLYGPRITSVHDYWKNHSFH